MLSALRMSVGRMAGRGVARVSRSRPLTSFSVKETPEKMTAVRVNEHGGPSVLRFETVPTPVPGPGEILVRTAFAGVNFLDLKTRTGRYPSKPPFTPGVEGSGRVHAIGPGTMTTLKVGDRVAYINKEGGAYAQFIALDHRWVIPVHAGVSLPKAAGILYNGITAHLLMNDCYDVQPGEACLVHAAAGGMGQVLCQVLSARGAHVIGTIGSLDKAQIAKDAGAAEVIVYTEVDFVSEVLRLTDGLGVDVVFDGVGKDTLSRGLDCLRKRGSMISYGFASGVPDAIDIKRLEAKSLHLARPVAFHYIDDMNEFRTRAAAVWSWIVDHDLFVEPPEVRPLEAAAAAHDDMGARKTAGKIVLAPWDRD